MSKVDADQSAGQYEQAMTARSETDRSDRPESPRLHDHYKPVGISAVSAAAHYMQKSKKPKQMG
jgi:hypothetical protein